MTSITRRTLFAQVASVPLLTGLTLAGWAATITDKRLVVVLLRGGMDGLAAVPPIGDPDYNRQRQTLAIQGARRLDGTFGLHPALSRFHRFYLDGELIAVHAAATPYRARSHFDGQDILESSVSMSQAARDGWLNRAIAQLPAASTASRTPAGIALSQSIPLILRGDASVTSWAPSVLPAGDKDTLDRIMDLYRDDPLLGPALSQALNTRDLAGSVNPREMRGTADQGKRRFLLLAKAAAKFLGAADGARVAVLEYGGWDIHANQGTTTGRLAQNLAGLDEGVGALADGLGAIWRETGVVIVTEFGRTVRPTGTNGTDHGTASAAFLLGGAVEGGRIIADWPGLSDNALYESRDLNPTTDMRALFKGLLQDHLRLPHDAVDHVFPDSRKVEPIQGLIRT